MVDEEQRRQAWEVAAELGPPKGPVLKVLEEEGVDQDVIDRVATRLVPYGNT